MPVWIAFVTASATLVYGAGTLLLWRENRQDRILRDKQVREEITNRKLHDLHTAFYEAWGYWEGHGEGIGSSPTIAVKMFEALIRLEGELRLNGYESQAQNLGYTIRNLAGVAKQLAEIGTVLGLVLPEYRHP